MNFPYLTGEVGKLGISKIKHRIVVVNNALVYDTFTGIDGALLTAHAPDIAPGGAVWVNYISPPGPTIQTNKLLSLIGGSVDAINSGAANAIISVTQDYNTNVNTTNGIVARLSDANHYWLLRHYNGELQIIENNAGFVLRASTPYVTGNITETLIATVNGNSMTLLIGATSVTYSSLLFNANTRHGIRAGSFAGIPITSDNFTIAAL